MGKFIKTVFGKSGVVSNVVDLVKVPQQIEQKKNEVFKIKERLNIANRELAELSEDQISITQSNLHQDFTQKEHELLQLQTNLEKMLKAKAEYSDIFGDGVNENLDVQICTYQNDINDCQQELNVIQLSYRLHITEREVRRQTLQNEIKELEDELSQKDAKLTELIQKKNRKQDQLNNNLGKVF
jgi:hypothetical protein